MLTRIDTNFVLHDIRAMKKRNVTITLDDETARWARVEAARRDMSVSQLVGDMLHEHMELELAYESAFHAFASVNFRPLKKSGSYPSRDELHDRTSSR